MSQPELSAEDKKWQAESDARTLAEADVISQDEKRIKAAKKAAETMSKEQMEQAKAMKKVTCWSIVYSLQHRRRPICKAHLALLV